MLPAGLNIAGGIKLYISQNQSKQNRNPTILTIYNALWYNFFSGRIKHCSDDSNYTFPRIQANKADILAHWSFTMLCGNICIAGRTKRCPGASNCTFLRIQANKTDILVQWPFPMLSDLICVAGRIKRCPEESNYQIIIKGNKTDILPNWPFTMLW